MLNNKSMKIIQIISLFLFILLLVLFIIGKNSSYDKLLKNEEEKDLTVIEYDDYLNRDTMYLEKEFPELTEAKLSIIKEAEEKQTYLLNTFKDKNYFVSEYSNDNTGEFIIWKPVGFYLEQNSYKSLNYNMGVLNMGSDSLEIDIKKTNVLLNTGEILYLDKNLSYSPIEGSSGLDYNLSFESKESLTTPDLKNAVITVYFNNTYTKDTIKLQEVGFTNEK